MLRETADHYRKVMKWVPVKPVFLPPPPPSGERGKIRNTSHAALRLLPAESARAGAMAQFWARLAEQTPEVEQFRSEVLGGRLLDTMEAATAFLSSPALAFFTLSELRSVGVPLVGHTAEVLERTHSFRAGRNIWWVSMRLTPPGIVLERTREEPMRNDKLLIAYPPEEPEEWVRHQPVRRGSVLHELLQVAEPLAPPYGWEDWHAPVFVVSGLVPPRSPLQVSTPTTWHARSGYQPYITLKVEPWLSIETVRAAYQQAQKQVYGGKVPQLVGVRNARLIGFVARYMGASGELPSSDQRRAIYEEWKRTQTDDEMQFPNLQEFNRALEQTHRRFLSLHSSPSSFVNGISEMLNADAAKEGQPGDGDNPS